MNILQRAQAGMWLSPLERTLVKMYQSIAPALYAALGITAAQIVSSRTISPTTAIVMLVSTAGAVILNGAAKYLSASADPTSQALGIAIGEVGAAFSARIGSGGANDGANDAKHLLADPSPTIETPVVPAAAPVADPDPVAVPADVSAPVPA